MSQAPNEDNSDPDQSDQATAGVDDAEHQRVVAERDELFDRLARLTADFRNSQKRLEQDSDQRVQYANEKLIKNLLPVIDNFERALAIDPQTTDTTKLLQGMQIVHDQLMKVLHQQQVEQIAPRPGEPFDPAHHQALMQQDDDRYETPTVTQLLQKGYTIHGRSLRPAGVAVSKGK